MSAQNQFMLALHGNRWDSSSAMMLAALKEPVNGDGDIERVKLLLDVGYDVDRPLLQKNTFFVTTREIGSHPKDDPTSFSPEALELLAKAPARKEKWGYPDDRLSL